MPAKASKETCQKDFGRQEVELGLETLTFYRSTQSSNNIKKPKKKIGNFLKKKDSKTLISMFDFVIWIDQTASQSLIFTSPSKIQTLKQAYVIFEHSLSFLK